MFSPLLCTIGAVMGWAAYTYISALRRNIQKARQSGLPYIVVPIHPFNFFWQLTFWLWVPLVKLLPRSWWENEMFIMLPDWAYKTGQEHFDQLGESFIVVSAEEITLFSESAEVIDQITRRREAFPKDTAKYGVLAMFGQNVLTTEGALWRLHRKVTSASFNEKNAAHTFAQAITQTQGLLASYFRSDADKRAGSTRTITSLEHDAMTWALNIIGYVGFGLHLLWPGQKLPENLDPKLAKYGSLDPPPGYTLNFATSMAMVLNKIVALMIIPSPILSRLPFKFAKQAWMAKENYLKYMDDFLCEKIAEVHKGKATNVGMDIMGQLVRSTYDQNESRKENAKLDDSDIIGNAFIMILAGHETTANILHFLLIELANNPATQRRLQKDIDTLFGDSDPATWDYEENVNAMFASHIGACVNETLRLLPPVTGIPKIVSANSDQTITIDGRPHILPSGLTISLLTVSAHRNPRWWPTKPSERTSAPTDLDDYLPERWYRASKTSNDAAAADDVHEDYGGFQGSDTSVSLYRPTRGSFVPFSDGPRSCLGRRIAMVELIAAVATVFQSYSVELAVDEWASDAEVDRMGSEEKRKVYAKAQEKTLDTLKNATSLLTLKLHGGKYVPVRALKKTDLELQLDEFLSENATQFENEPKLAPYFNTRARIAGSPVKREAPELKVSKRRATIKAAEDLPVDTEEEETQPSSTSSVLVRTPGRALSLAQRIPLPATPAELSQAVDRTSTAVRERVTSIYQDSGITEATQTARESLSTVTSVLFAIAAFELYSLRPELLPNRYAFTIPAVSFLGTSDHPVHLPDVFVLLTASFWAPALTWTLTSFVLPSLFGYFFNLSAAAKAENHSSRGRPRATTQPEYVVDPLTFSIVKAVATYVVYAQGVTFGGWIDPVSVSRINSALYSGWKGVLTGAATTGVAAVYDAVLRK
ncbi:cytochrome P450 [Podospora didyma]|uniref:Cytochrome P450 n=1 Tax=Podospora didyma TaxID=330526 RepID=A0AAE0KJP1_9PEZI|nr:cytochrome P450 [Podospora didyma]